MAGSDDTGIDGPGAVLHRLGGPEPRPAAVAGRNIWLDVPGAVPGAAHWRRHTAGLR